MRGDYAVALHFAAANGHSEVAKLLLKHKADPNVENSEKNTPLHWACLNGHVEVSHAHVSLCMGRRGGVSCSASASVVEWQLRGA